MFEKILGKGKEKIVGYKDKLKKILTILVIAKLLTPIDVSAQGEGEGYKEKALSPEELKNLVANVQGGMDKFAVTKSYSGGWVGKEGNTTVKSYTSPEKGFGKERLQLIDNGEYWLGVQKFEYPRDPSRPISEYNHQEVLVFYLDGKNGEGNNGRDGYVDDIAVYDPSQNMEVNSPNKEERREGNTKVVTEFAGAIFTPEMIEVGGHTPANQADGDFHERMGRIGLDWLGEPGSSEGLGKAGIDSGVPEEIQDAYENFLKKLNQELNSQDKNE